MAVITLRQSNVVTSNGAIIKNSFVSPQEVDNNFSNINIELGSLSNSIVSTSISLTQELNNTNSFLTSFVTTNLNATSNNLISIVNSNVAYLTNYVNDTANYTNNSVGVVYNSLNVLSNSTTTSISNILSNTLTQFAPTSSEQLRGLITDETGFGNLVYSNSPTIFNSSIENSTLKSSTERANVVNDIAPVEITYNLVDQTILYYTSNSTANITLNFTGNSNISLDSYLNVSNTISSVVLLTNGAVPKYIQNVKVDGVVVANATIKGNLYWLGNSITIPGNPVGIDLYSFTIVKTSSNVYTILGSQSFFKSFL